MDLEKAETLGIEVNALENTCYQYREQKEKGATEDKLVGCHHQLNGHEFVQTLGGSERQGNLACYRPWGRKELDTVE